MAAVAPTQIGMSEPQKRQGTEHSAAYRALMDSELICDDYEVKKAEDLDVIKGEWDVVGSCCLQGVTLCGCLGCCCIFFTVNAGCVRKGTLTEGTNVFFGPGIHVLSTIYSRVDSGDLRVNQGAIVNGTKAIITVAQGFIGLAMDKGHPILLPPGMHQWDSPTLEFEKMIDLATNVITMGPLTLVTVDQGYSAVTQDNGQLKILEGGKSYMLTHRNWKFEHFITQKIQTDNIGPFNVSTGDNVPLEARATVNWIVEDPTTAARMAASTISSNKSFKEGNLVDSSLKEVREDVIRQVTASLAAYVGSIRYGVHGNAGANAAIEGSPVPVPGSRSEDHEPESEDRVGRRALFDPSRMTGSVQHANAICQRYGVKILSINLISASPSDRTLVEAMSQGAIAAVAAEQTETAARGEANALLIRAKAQAEAQKIQAAGDAAAEQIRAEGSLLAAKRLEESQVAVQIARMKVAGTCLADGKANTFFFGLQGAGDLPAGLLGSALANQARH